MERSSFILLLAAIVFEVIGTSAMKHTQGLTRLLPIAVMLCAYALTFGLMAVAIKTIPVNVAYAIWSGLGTAGIAVVGWLFFRESLTPWSVLGIGLIVAGVVVLNTLGMSASAHGVPSDGTAREAAAETPRG